MKSKRQVTLIVVSILIVFALVLAVEKLSRPRPLTYDAAVENIEKVNDSLKITFSKDVSDYELNIYNSLKSDISKDKMQEVVIVAWKSPLRSYLKTSRKNESFDLKKIDRIMYSEISDSGINKVVYEKEASNGGSSLLPRLSMNYYLITASLTALVSLLATFFFKNNKQLKQTFTTLLMLSTSYLVSSVIVLGFNQTTYFMKRDLLFIMVLSTLLFILSRVKFKTT